MNQGGQVIFRGTTEDALALGLATQRYCAADRNCVPNALKGVGDSCGVGMNAGHHCAAHAMLFDQTTVDALLFMRRIAAQLWAEECCLPPLPHHGLALPYRGNR